MPDMCGIVGMINARAPVVRETLAAMSDALSHRGPDAEGLWFSADGRTGLAHRRLSIIDLTEAADQPMVAVERRHVLVFNGEIYNYRELSRELAKLGHRFRTSSDTEILCL